MHPHWDWDRLTTSATGLAHPCRNCKTLGSPLPHLHRDQSYLLRARVRRVRSVRLCRNRSGSLLEMRSWGPSLICYRCTTSHFTRTGAAATTQRFRFGVVVSKRPVHCQLCSARPECNMQSSKAFFLRPWVQHASCTLQWVQIMPQVILTSKICPKGVEATMYAVLAGEHALPLMHWSSMVPSFGLSVP